MAERFLLTGASGFLGSHLLRGLVDSPVAAVTHRSPVSADTRGELVTIDSRRDDWTQRVRDFGPTVVIHAATRFQVQHDARDISPMIRANVEFGTEVLQAAHELDARVITLSSSWQHVNGSDYDPLNLYAATKQAFDDIAAYFKAQGLQITRLILFDVYGPGDIRRKLVPLLLESVQTGVPLEASSGHQLIDLTYVDDVVRAIMIAAFDSMTWPDHPWAVRSGAVTIRHLADAVSRAAGRSVPVIWGARPERPREMRCEWEVGPTVPGWSPSISLVEGIRRVWEADHKMSAS